MAALTMTRKWTLISILWEQGATGSERDEPGNRGQGQPRVPMAGAVCSDEADLRRSWEARGKYLLRGRALARLQHSSGTGQGRQPGLECSSCAEGQSHTPDV